VFYVASDPRSGGTALGVWGGLKIALISAVLGWYAVQLRSWAFGLVAGIFLLIGLEDAIGVTAPLGLWLIEESGIRRGRRGGNTQLIRRVVVMLVFLGPTLQLARRAAPWVRRVLWTMIGFLGALFLVGVLGDAIADHAGSDFDELLEEPLTSLCAAYAVGLAVQGRTALAARGPTRTQRL